MSDEPYATLSHCWGSNGLNFITTVSSNYERLSYAISNKSLPPTFRDAVKITPQLHLRYLCIDSLCVVQDSQDDWQMESSQMGDVYRWAFINIAATGAENSEDGRLFDRDALAIRPTRHSVTWITNEGLKMRTYRVVPRTRDLGSEDQRSTPLMARTHPLPTDATFGA